MPEDGFRSLRRQVRELFDVYRDRPPGSLDDRHFLATRILSLSRRLESFRPHDSPEAPSGPADVRDLCGYQLNLLNRIFARHFVRGRPKPRPRDVRRIFFLAWLGGLCNRLRTVCALSAVSELSAIPFQWNWTPNGTCPGSLAPTGTLESLGQLDFSILAETFLGCPSNTLILSNPFDPATIYRRFLAHRGVDERIFHAVYRSYQWRFLSALTDCCGMAERIEETRGKLGTAYRAAHVRRTDKVRRWNKLRPDIRFPTTQDYAEILDELLEPRERFFFCCDDAAVLSEFRCRYGERAMTFDGEFSEGFRQTSLEHAVADLVLLSGASLVIGTPESSFSSFAIHAGNTESRWPRSLPERFSRG